MPDETEQSNYQSEDGTLKSTAGPSASDPANSSDSNISPGSPTNPDKKRSLLAIAVETFKYIEYCENDKKIVFRHNDQRSAFCIAAAVVLGMILFALLNINPSYAPTCLLLAVIADVLFGLAIIWYVLQRLGVLRVFEPRQAILTWQLMMGACAMLTFLIMNLIFIFVAYFYAINHIAGH